MPLELPANLVASVRGDVDHGSSRRAWLAALPHIVDELTDRWWLRLGEPFQPGGTCSWVAPARDGAGRDLVLKVGWPHHEALSEAEALRAWDGRAAVTLHDDCTTSVSTALLLERCRPGTPLAAVPEPAQDAVVAGLLRRLWIAPPAGGTFQALALLCRTWASVLEARVAAAPAVVDPGLVRGALHLLRELPTTAADQVLLGTDLHAGNILSARREPWLAIDPKPFVGDPTFDPLQHLLNCQERLVADPHGLTARMAGLLDLDPQRLEQWLFARCMVEALDQPPLRDVATSLAPS